MRNCKKIVLIQYQNLHKSSVKRPVSLKLAPAHTYCRHKYMFYIFSYIYIYRYIGIQQFKFNYANNMYGRKQHIKATDDCLGWVIHIRNYARVQCLKNGRLDSAFPTQGDGTTRSFAQESNAGSEASHRMVPSKNNNRNQYNYCCKLTHFF